jgi:hypothetical protein
MLMKVIGLMIIALGIMIYIFVDGTYLPNQPCRPLRYLDGSEMRKPSNRRA